MTAAQPSSARRCAPISREATPLSGALSLSVIIVTWRRAQYVKRCLDALHEQDKLPEEVVVVDASEDDLTKCVALGFPGVKYVHFPGGAGHMTTARNEGLRHVTGDIIAFIDDDTRPRRDWARCMAKRFEASDIAALAGRTLNGVPGEESNGVSDIGRIHRDGRLSGNFAANPGCLVKVDHGIGANMSFRREWLGSLGGFRDVFAGTAIREDADIFLRIKNINGESIFDPDVVVDHLPAPHVRGKRFDVRYTYFAERNHVLLLCMNMGCASPTLWRYLRVVLRSLPREEPQRRKASRAVRGLVRVIGCFTGLLAGVHMCARFGAAPRRNDSIGLQISSALSEARSSDGVLQESRERLESGSA